MDTFGTLQKITDLFQVEQNKNVSVREECPYSEFFWSVFSRIRLNTEIYCLNIHILSKCGDRTNQENSKYGNFLRCLY